jgi:tetratricopeptide (TPR) repeat protein
MTPSGVRAALAASWLLLLCLAVYAPVRSAGFIWDDDQNVSQNRNLEDAAGLARIWLEPRTSQQYYPLVHTGFWLERRLWGLDPRGYHVTNVLLHALCAVLLWRVLLALRVPGALLAASLFAVHPVMVESVAWITERKNVLSLAFALGALAAYLRFAPPDGEPPEPRRRGATYALSLALFACGLLSKTVVFSLPAVIAVILWWKRGKLGVRELLPLAPFLPLGAVAGLHTAWLEKDHVGAVGAEWTLGVLDRLVLAGRALWFYAGKLAWPEPVIFFYPRWHVDAAEPWQWVPPLAALAVVAALWGARERIGRGPLAAVLLFGGILFPALGFFDVYAFRYSYVADHFQYHAAPALLALFAAGATRAAARLEPGVRRFAPAAALVLLAALGALSFREAHAYRDLDTLYREVLAKNGEAWNAHLNLANSLSSQGRNAEGLPHARAAARLAPGIADAWNTLGGLLFLDAAASPAGGGPLLEESIAAFERAVAIEPGHVDALANGAVALEAAGRRSEAAEWRARLAEAERAAR